MHRLRPDCRTVARRTFLARSGWGVGAAALALLEEATARGAASLGEAAPDGSPSAPHRLLPPRAKRVIFLCMAGGPSHLETLDYKPRLAALHGQPMPESLTRGQPIAQLQGQQLRCLGPQHPFRRWGESGAEISTVLPHIGAKIADDICIVRSLTTKAINHDPAHTFMNTGSTISGRPSMGAWLWYGLGTESANLPGFIVLVSAGGGQGQPIASRQWHSGFLPTRYQGVHFHSHGDPVLYINRPAGVSLSQQRGVIDEIQALNRLRAVEDPDPELATRIEQYEMAFRMQTSVPRLVDFRDESPATLALYGASGGDGSFAANCLLARRLAEQGVRFIQLYHRGWDHHGGIREGVRETARHVDQASAALVLDLKQRGMLDETLVVWAGEFGRTPMAQGDGRDHHIKGFSMWMAGGGVRPGVTHGATDELGYHAVDQPVEVHDLHATMLHLLGIDHLRLTVRAQGREFRLTDVHGRVVENVLA